MTGCLPEVSNKRAIVYDYFPTTWQAVVWRNWGYIPVERIAKALQTTVDNVRTSAKLMGLNPIEVANPEWEKRGYLTIIRDNWHLCTYEQILTLLDISAEQLAFILKEDDFMWFKLGTMKPAVETPRYSPLTKEQEHQTRWIAELFNNQFPKSDNAFSFVREFQKAIEAEEELEVVQQKENGIRMVYPYFALYGDALMDPSIDPLPERMLAEYAKVGINGIWMQAVLYQLVEFPFDVSMSQGWKRRIEALKNLVNRAKKYGIGIYLYLNEPRAMPDRFFEKYPHLRGEQEGDFYAMCTSTPEVQEYLYQSVNKLFQMVPDLAGFLTITMSENLTNCYSRLAGRPNTCPRCKNRNPWEVVAEVNNIMAKAAHDAVPEAKVIVWDWSWDEEWVEKAIPLLTEGQILQCTSEKALPFCIGGIDGTVSDYTMSQCGPGERAKRLWRLAEKSGLQVSAKVQINNTWEMAVVPYIPVFDKIAQHIQGLQDQQVQHLQASWTLGGCPSPNHRLVTWLMDKRGTVEEFLENWLGEQIGSQVNEAQKKLSNAFSHFPFHIDALYNGPQNFGTMTPFFLERTGYQATMVGFPYDDLAGWIGNYPTEVYEDEYRQLCEGWQEGVRLLEIYEGINPELDEMIVMAKVILCQFKSAYHHIRFVQLRGDDASKVGVVDREKLLQIIREEMITVEELIALRMEDARVGYESSNHYFYTLQDLKEKMINLAYCERKLKSL